MNDFDEAFELIGGIFAAVTLLVVLLTWLESSLAAGIERRSRQARPDADTRERLPASEISDSR